MADASAFLKSFMPAAAGSSRQATLSCAVDNVPDATWDGALAAFDDSHHEQTACYAVKHWNSRDSHLLLRDGDVPVAGARLAVITLPALNAGLAFLRFGPFWRRRDKTPDWDVYRSAIAALVDEYCVRRGHCLSITPRPHPDFYRLECAVLSECGFAVRRKVADPNRYLVDVSLDEETLMRSLEQKWRYNLRQALANNFDIRLCESDDDLRTFQSLYGTMVSRKNFSSTTPVHLIDELRDGLPAPLRPRLVMAFHQGRPVVGATIGLFGDTAYYMFGASDDAALSLKGGYALQWWIVRWLRAQGVRWYDLGGEADQRGLRQFKKGLVGKRGTVVVMNGEYDRWTQWSGRAAADLIYSLRAAQRALRHWRDRG
jgi:hypothetical protein